ncbi:uncharacterized protein LOC143371390 [Andrena cerasifolii]|uniref:uncharacterized protein LOC143371390 n=1 Tax=Andrena cerasifolii TaxID=2819439 RepID=UPI004037DA90
MTTISADAKPTKLRSPGSWSRASFFVQPETEVSRKRNSAASMHRDRIIVLDVDRCTFHARRPSLFSRLQILFAVIRSEFRRMGFRIDPRNRGDDGSRCIRVVAEGKSEC